MHVFPSLIATILLYLCSATAFADDMQGDSYNELQAQYTDIDPYESFNRSMFAFNDTLDVYVAVPAARFYRFITPNFVDKGVTNFFGNLDDAGTVVNSLLQGKFHNATVALSRVIFNTVFGLGGFIDVATSFELEADKEDFGQTLGVWGYEESAYLVLPVLGPSTFRDAGGKVVDYFADPVDYVLEFEFEESLALKALDLIDTRADLLSANNLLFQEDKYAFMRSAYLQNRDYLINDGEVDDLFSDEEFDYEDF